MGDNYINKLRFCDIIILGDEMIVEKDLKSSLIEKMSKQHKNILIDFANNFLGTFNDCITREELLKRINRLNYIGFEREENVDERCGKADAEYNSSYQKIIITI